MKVLVHVLTQGGHQVTIDVDRTNENGLFTTSVDTSGECIQAVKTSIAAGNGMLDRAGNLVVFDSGNGCRPLGYVCETR